MAQFGSGNQQIRIDIAVVVQQAKEAISQLREAEKALRNLQSAAGAPRIVTGQTAQIEAQAKSYKQLGFEADVASRKVKAGGKSVSVGLRSLTGDVSRYTSDQRRMLKNYKEEMDRIGVAIVGRPKDRAQLANNRRILKEYLGDTKKAGIANAEVLNGLATGAAAVGGRGFTSFERFRISAFSLNRGLQSVGYNMVNLAKNSLWTGKAMSMNLSLPITAFATLAAREFVKVQEQIFQLRKVTEFKDVSGDAEAQAEGIEFYDNLKTKIRDTAIELGKSQAQIAGIFKDVAALGVPDDLIDQWGIAIAELAAVGDIDTKTASEFFRTTNALFTEDTPDIGEKLKKTTEIMAQFSAISDETSLQLKDLADAFPEVAPVMEQMGFEADEVAASLAGMFRRGIPASEAAHALKFAFQRIVGPTKDASKIINDLGISFFDTSGKATDGRKNVLAMSASLLRLSDAERAAAFGDLFGNRQVARLVSFAKDVELGEREITQAFSDGVFNKEDLDRITSDYARALIASGKVVEEAEAKGIRVEEFETALDRYTKAISEFKKDPATQWQGMITMWKANLVEVGAIIVPIITEWGRKLQGLLQAVVTLPPPFLKFAGVLALMAAAIGPLILGFSSLEMVGGSALKIFGKLVPRMGVRDIIPEKAAQLLREAPDRDDIGFLGSRTFQITDKERAGKKFTKAPKITGMGSLFKATGFAEGAADDLGDFRKELQGSLDQLSRMKSAGPESMAAIEQATRKASNAVSNFDVQAQFATDRAETVRRVTEKQGAGAPRLFGPEGDIANARQAVDFAEKSGREAAEVALRETQKAEKILAREKRKFADKARLFGVAEGRKGGILSGMTYSRFWGNAAEKGIAGRMKRISAIMLAPLNPKTIFRAGANFARDTAAGFREGGRAITGAFGDSSVGPMGKLLSLFKGLKFALIPLTLAAGKFILIASAIGVVVGALTVLLYGLFKTVKDNWDSIYTAIKPSLDALMSALRSTWEAVQALVAVFKDAVGSTLFFDWFESADNAAQSGVGWRTFADVLKKVIGIITDLVNKITEALKSDVVRAFADNAGKAVGGFIGVLGKFFALFGEGDWSTKFEDFWNYLLYATVKYLRPLLEIVQFAMQQLMNILANAFRGIGEAVTPDWLKTWFPNVANEITNMFGGVADELDRWGEKDWVADLNAWVDALGLAKWEVGGIGSSLEDLLKTDYVDEIAEDTQEMADGMGEAADSAGRLKNILADFLSILKPKVREQMDALRDSLVSAMEAAHNAKIDKIDAQIDAINNAKKAEEELLAEQQRIERKRELMNKRALDVQQYQRNRALAIYEGRVSDVRSLDLDFEQSTRSFNKDLLGLEKERAQSIKDKSRDAEIEKLNKLKSVEEEIYEERKKAFDKQIELIMLYEPKTIAEFDGMIGQLKNLAIDFSIAWPESARTGGEYFLAAIDAANTEVIKTFGWAGEAGIMNWVMAFISSDAWAILMHNATEAAGSVGQSMGSAMGQGITDGVQQSMDSMVDLDLVTFEEWASLDPNSALYKNVLNNWGNIERTNEAWLRENAPNSTTAQYAKYREEKNWRALGGMSTPSYDAWKSAQPAGPTNRLPTDPLGPMAPTGAKSTKLVGDTLRRAGSAIGDMLQRTMAQHGQNVSNAFVGGVQSRSPFLQQQTESLFTNNVIAPTKQVFLIESPSKVFQGFGIDIVDGLILGLSLGNIAGRMIDIIGFAIRSTVGAGPMMISSLVGFFMSIPGKLIDALKWGFSTAGGKVIEFGKEILKTLAGFLEDSVFSNVRDFSIFGVRPFEKLPNLKELVEKYHSGGIVGQSGGISAGPIKADEVSAILQKGEGVLPISAMNKIGPRAFEMLRRGMVGDAFAMSMQGRVRAMAPRIPTRRGPADRNMSMTSANGDIYIHVDTFIGQEEWFNQLASQYDMKVSARRAKANGSQSRVISSYNSNERNTYR
jgi:TP901 family phage tail tape measure protein